MIKILKNLIVYFCDYFGKFERALMEAIQLSLLVASLCNSALAQAAPRIADDSVPPKPNDVSIASNAIAMPFGRILLIRSKDQKHGAVKLINIKTGKTSEDRTLYYEYWYQPDGTVNLLNKAAKIGKGRATTTRPYGFARFVFDLGNSEIKCGAISIFSSADRWIYFHGKGQGQGDHRIELAPTKWNDIKEVIVLDPRIKWYRYDEHRPRTDIPVDELW